MMSENLQEQLYRIATALETMANQGKSNQLSNNELAHVINEIELIMDTFTNEFTLRKALRDFICEIKGSLEQ